MESDDGFIISYETNDDKNNSESETKTNKGNTM